MKTVTVTNFLDIKLNACDGCKAAVTAKIRINQQESQKKDSCYLETGFSCR